MAWPPESSAAQTEDQRTDGWINCGSPRCLRASSDAGNPLSGVDSRCSQIPEPPGLNAVLLHLEVQGLVVGAEVSRRLALVPPAGVEGLADRLRSEEHTSELQSPM